MSPSSVSYPEELLCTESGVYDLVASLDVSKASGQDGISARMLKATACSIAPSLTKLFNLSLQSSTIPSVWKKSLVVPIPKNSEMKDPTNYRPISLLPIVSKVLERLPTSVANVCSKVNLFADDVLLYHTISEEADYEALQTAISLIESWSISNFLAFNTS